jgi:hypothetical protein
MFEGFKFSYGNFENNVISIFKVETKISRISLNTPKSVYNHVVAKSN